MTRATIEVSQGGAIDAVREQVPTLMPEAGEQAKELLVPQAGAYFLDPLDVDDVTTQGVPVGYVPARMTWPRLGRPEFAADIADVEVKNSSGGLPKSLRDALSAFSNTRGGGSGFYDLARSLGYLFREDYISWAPQAQDLFKLYGKPGGR